MRSTTRTRRFHTSQFRDAQGVGHATSASSTPIHPIPTPVPTSLQSLSPPGERGWHPWRRAVGSIGPQQEAHELVGGDREGANSVPPRLRDSWSARRRQ